MTNPPVFVYNTSKNKRIRIKKRRATTSIIIEHKNLNDDWIGKDTLIISNKRLTVSSHDPVILEEKV